MTVIEAETGYLIA